MGKMKKNRKTLRSSERCCSPRGKLKLNKNKNKNLHLKLHEQERETYRETECH